ncbi:hypothetical protein [Micromonospora sp. CB01531]|uniref:hypothetical protein n=1 Tax=Micromonospora sp. CB01531 TaxID=1718947 RepID=UPI00093A0305|nr:hypothetical protein [Micromonospora sp. CB01531]OKI84548.1 hypothetical protein A6A27_40400 [Micromonospora sp. CB01531]
MTAHIGFPGGGTGHLRASMWSSSPLRIRAQAIVDRGTLTVSNSSFRICGRFTVVLDGRRRRERFDSAASYVHQLRAFATTVRREPTNLTSSHSVITMSLIEDVHSAAGPPLPA